MRLDRRYRLWRELVSTKLPSLDSIEAQRKIIRAGNNNEVGQAFRLGILDRAGANRRYVQTRGGNFTCAIVYPEAPAELVTLVVWWSYRTPIAVMSPVHAMSFESSYKYSVTTTQHHSEIARVSWCQMLAHEGDIGGGDLTAEGLMREARERYLSAVADITRRRKPSTWKRSVMYAVQDIVDMAKKVGIEPQVPPIEQVLSTNPKASAKLIGWQFLDPAMGQFVRQSNDQLIYWEH